MGLEMGLAVTLLSFGGGVMSGLLGISGAVLMVPLLLYVPPLLGLDPLTVKTVAAVAIVQGLFASTSGLVAHGRSGYVNRHIALIAGGSVAVGALAGGVLSRWAPDTLLLAVFAGLATSGVVLMATPYSSAFESDTRFVFHRPWRLGIFFPEGILVGMVGVGGGFIATPILHRIFGVPIRVAIASALAMSWFGAVAGFLGKAVTGQIPLWLSVAVVLGAVPGAQLGALVNRRIPRSYLRYTFASVLVAISLSMWMEVLARFRMT